MQSWVTSHLDYSNGILVNLRDNALKPLQRIQNMAAKITLGMRKYDSSTEALRTLHWLPIKQRIKFKICLMVEKCIRNEAPEYLQNLIKVRSNNTNMALRNDDDLEIPRTTGSHHGERAFSVAGPKLYNSLPDVCKNTETIISFKKKLKTHFFREAFINII